MSFQSIMGVMNLRAASFLIPTKRTFKKAAKRIIPLALAVYFIPIPFAAFFSLGLLDFIRNSRRTLGTFDRYFAGDGVFTWILSPFNLFVDLLCLPYWNRGVYKLSDLPDTHQSEIKAMMAAASGSDLVDKLNAKLGDKKRGMFFFKWYGRNVPGSVDAPALQQDFKYIQTIGVSIFNSRQSTGRHFGPLRLTLRVLYNINDIDSQDVYIEVGEHVNRWRDNKLFIFDDTLQHQSVNQSDGVRYCMFVDILRPTFCSGILRGLLACVRVVVARFNAAFYKHWTVIK